MVEFNEYAEFLSQVEPKWHNDFVNFIKAGDASEEFTVFLNADEACQDAVDAVINAEGAAFERLASILSGGETDSSGAASARIALLSYKTMKKTDPNYIEPEAKVCKYCSRKVHMLLGGECPACRN